MVHETSCVTGINLHVTLAPVSSQKVTPASTVLEGQERPQGVIGLGAGELHHNGTHWRLLLISRKDRVPNWNVRAIQRLRCQLGRFDFGRQLTSDAEHWPTSTGQFADGCDPSGPNWAGSGW
jgi:hypothetical protein